jgi:oxygen-independent coproporphyrinogen III oxidase
MVEQYLTALAADIAAQPAGRLATFFAGGGTPTLLTASQWEGVMDQLQRRFSWAPGYEATVECNPESSETDKLRVLRTLGINRLSFGVQAAQEELLKRLNRLHDWTDAVAAVRAARATGFDNINVDVMFGLPGQTLADWRETLNRVIGLQPEHVSAYALSVEEETVFGRHGVVPDDDLQADMYEEAAERLCRAGYDHYEISNFARPGFAARHNLRYWRNRPCLGVGLGAAHFDGRIRHKNTDNLADYIDRLTQGRSPVVESEELPSDQGAAETLMLGLRLKTGVSLRQVPAHHRAALDTHTAAGLLIRCRGRYRPTRRGWLLSNRIFQELLAA